jgi:hypothetical protein
MARLVAALALIALCTGNAAAHEISEPPPLEQPHSPVKLQSCYLGTNFTFDDPKLQGEETKMQLSAAAAKPVPTKYQAVGLRFEFGLAAHNRSEDVVVFTSGHLAPSGYLPRVDDYDDYRCAVDFATSLDRKTAWFDAQSDIVPCSSAAPIPRTGSVWLTALELEPHNTDAVFLTTDREKGVYWNLNGTGTQFEPADDFGRAVVSFGHIDSGIFSLSYGAAPDKLDQRVCFHPFLNGTVDTK